MEHECAHDYLAKTVAEAVYCTVCSKWCWELRLVQQSSSYPTTWHHDRRAAGTIPERHVATADIASQIGWDLLELVRDAQIDAENARKIGRLFPPRWENGAV